MGVGKSGELGSECVPSPSEVCRKGAGKPGFESVPCPSKVCRKVAGKPCFECVPSPREVCRKGAGKPGFECMPSVGVTLRASLSGTFLQSLPQLVTPLKGHCLSPRTTGYAIARQYQTLPVKQTNAKRGQRPVSELLVATDVASLQRRLTCQISIGNLSVLPPCTHRYIQRVRRYVVVPRPLAGETTH